MTDSGAETGTAALIAQAERMSRYVQRGGPDDGTVYDRLAVALKRLREELEDAEDRRGNAYLKLEDTVVEQAATIAALKAVRADAWDEGASSAYDHACNDHTPSGLPIDPPRNPYLPRENV